jgi:hypothetical protein
VVAASEAIPQSLKPGCTHSEEAALQTEEKWMEDEALVLTEDVVEGEDEDEDDDDVLAAPRHPNSGPSLPIAPPPGAASSHAGGSVLLRAREAWPTAVQRPPRKLCL